MNILIIHGDNTQKSYQRLKEVEKKSKEKGWEIERSLENVKSKSLFTDKRVAILYFDKTLSAIELKKLPKEAKIEEYKLPKIIFSFLESFIPKNTKKCIFLLHEIIKTSPPEFVFALLSRQIRDLYWVRREPKTLKYPFWRIAKLKMQSSKFSEENLENIISKLAEIDIDAKTSKSDLIGSLDLLIIKNLQ